MQHDLHVHKGDCMDLLTMLEPDSVQLTVTSPPYDQLRKYGGNFGHVDYAALAAALYRVHKQGGVVVWVVADQTVKGSETMSSFRQAQTFVDAGWRLHDTMIWCKDTAAFPDRIRYSNVFEYMFVFSKGRPGVFTPIKDKPNRYAGTKVHGTYRDVTGELKRRSDKWSSRVIEPFGKRDNVWRIPGEKRNRTGHPAVFPLQLASDHVRSWSAPGDVVLDPFMGSGTTGVACAELGRRFIGAEIVPDFFEGAAARLVEAFSSRAAA